MTKGQWNGWRQHAAWVSCAVLAGCGVLLSAAQGETPAASSSEMAHLLSRLQSMSHGYYPAKEWNEVIGEMNLLVARAKAAGDLESMIDITAVLANVYSDVLGMHEKAANVLLDLKGYLADKSTKGMPKVYVRLAEVYARAGDEAAIVALIEEFKQSPAYDPRAYEIQPAETYGEPWRIQRPFAAGDDSLTVSAMRRALRESAFAVGRRFPDVELVSRADGVFRTGDLTGKVLLLDFWLPGWIAWERDLPALVDLHRTYGPHGFVVIGIPLQTNGADLDAFMAQRGIAWTQVEPTRELLRLCGVTGDATSYLIDSRGVILGRNLRGSELRAAVKRGLGL